MHSLFRCLTVLTFAVSATAYSADPCAVLGKGGRYDNGNCVTGDLLNPPTRVIGPLIPAEVTAESVVAVRVLKDEIAELRRAVDESNKALIEALKALKDAHERLSQQNETWREKTLHDALNEVKNLEGKLCKSLRDELIKKDAGPTTGCDPTAASAAPSIARATQ
jgi:TolA-binding protein